MTKVTLTRIDSLEENKVTLSGEEVSIGRGSILGCDDKRISRKHGLLQVSDDGSVTLFSMHSNPCFYKEQGADSYTVLVKGGSKVLRLGDEFALLPDSFRYRVGVPTLADNNANDVNDNANGVASEATPSKRKRTLPGWLTGLSAGNTSGPPSSVTSSRKRKTSTGGIEWEGDKTPKKQGPPATSSRKRKASVEGNLEEDEEARIKQESPAVSGSPSPSSAADEKVEASVKQESPAASGSPPSATDEIGEARVKEEPPATISPSPPSTPIDQDEGGPDTPKKQDGANGNKDGYEAEYGDAAATSSSRRPACPYGATCYRRNPAHRTEDSHPGDPDYPVLPECPYGTTCYRRNPQHRRDYGHTGPPATPPPPQGAAAASPTSNVNYYSCNVTYNVCPKCQSTTCIDLTKDE